MNDEDRKMFNEAIELSKKLAVTNKELTDNNEKLNTDLKDLQTNNMKLELDVLRNLNSNKITNNNQDTLSFDGETLLSVMKGEK